MAQFYGSNLVLGIYILAMSLCTDGSKITWLEPPPFETVTDASSTSRTSKSVIKGSLDEELSCNFSLTADLSITSVSMKFRDQPAVTFVLKVPNATLRVEPVFANHFNAVWVPNKLTLTLFNVTDAVEGQYCCEVITTGRSTRTWIRKIQLLVLDPSQATVSSIVVFQDPIQTTVSRTTASEDKRQKMVSSTTVPQYPILTTESPNLASEVGNPGTIIGIVIAVVAALFILIAIGCYLERRMKRRKGSKKVHVDEEGNERVRPSTSGSNGDVKTGEQQSKDTPV